MSILLRCSWFFLVMAISVWAAESDTAAPNDWRQEIEQIDKEIQELEEKKNLHEANADRLDAEGDRLQVYSDRLVDARMAWERARQQRQKMVEAQNQIDELKKEREMLLKHHGEAS